MAQTADTRAVGRILHILLPLVALILPVLLLSLSSPSLNTPRSYYYTTLYDGWTVEMNGVTETEVDVTTSHIRWRNKGDTAVMRHALPVLDDTGAPLSIIAPCVMFPTSLSTVCASVGDEEIYAYGQELADAGLMVPRHVHFIPLDGTSPGSELVLTITSTESGSLLTLPRIFFGNREDLRRSFIEERRLPLFVGGFLVTFAFVLLILSSYLYLYHGHDLSLLPCAAISFVLGIYIQSYNDIFGYLTDNDRLFTDAEYFSLYMTPLTLVVFICVDRRELLKEKFSRITILFFLVANALFPAVALVCHLLNIIHLNRFLPGLHIMAVVEWLVMVPMLVFRFLSRIRGYRQEVRMETKKQDGPTGYARFASDNSLLVGLVIFMVCAGIDIIRYNLVKYSLSRSMAHVDINYTVFGALCFVMSLLLNYFFHSIEHIYAGSERQRLEGLAYTDTLTGLANRTRCEKVLMSLTGDYTVISLDLDHLKQVNDHLGHEEGDRLLRAFANELKKTFPDARVVGRSGGDEFLAAFAGINREMCEERLAELQTSLDLFNKEEHAFRLSASWGYATSDERRRTGDTGMDVYKLADARMYEMKEAHHDKRMRRMLFDIDAAGELLPEDGGVFHD